MQIVQLRTVFILQSSQQFFDIVDQLLELSGHLLLLGVSAMTLNIAPKAGWPYRCGWDLDDVGCILQMGFSGMPLRLKRPH